MLLKTICLFPWIMFLALLAPAQSFTPHDAHRALQCLQPDTPSERKFLRLDTDVVSYRITNGGVPNTSDERVSFQLVTLVFYSPDGTRAIVSSGALTLGNEFLMLSDQYRVKRVRGKWRTETGQGSTGTYQRVSNFVSEMASQPVHTFTIVRADKSICIAESEWNVAGSKYIKDVRPARSGDNQPNK